MKTKEIMMGFSGKSRCEWNAIPCCFAVLLWHLFSFGQASTEQQEIEYYRGIGIQPLTNGSYEGELSPGNFLIPHDLIIEKGKTLTIKAGCTILFSQNAMLVVNGKLICSGITESPVIFRRLENQKYFEPIDSRVETRWDGIYLPDYAQLEMTNTIVSGSKYGIVISGRDVSMVLNGVTFSNNKFQNVKIGNREMKMAENSPVVFRYPEQEGVFEEPAVVKFATETIQTKQGPLSTEYPKIRAGMGIVGLAGLGIGVAGILINNKYTGNEGNESLAMAGTAGAVGGAIMFGIGAVGFVWTFFY